MKALIAATCIAILAAVGLYIYRDFFPREAQAALVATPRKIAKCEKAAADIIISPPDKDYLEGEGRYGAITITECDDLGILTPNEMKTIMQTKLAPFIKAYQADRNVWTK